MPSTKRGTNNKASKEDVTKLNRQTKEHFSNENSNEFKINEIEITQPMIISSNLSSGQGIYQAIKAKALDLIK